MEWCVVCVCIGYCKNGYFHCFGAAQAKGTEDLT